MINSKIKEGDSIFLKDSLGVNEFKHLKDIKIEPIADVYKFIENKPENFDLIKLLSEDENIKKVILDNTTSKNYAYHIIDFSTSESTTPEKTVKPILYYLNNSDYFKSIQKEYLNNIKLKMTANDSIISQINGVLNSFTSAVNGSQRNDKLIYYNENTQLNDIIETKDKLIKEQGYYRLDLVDSGKIIKNTGSIINIKNTGSINGKRKFILPFVFILVFILVVFFKSFYKNQLEKSKLE